MSPPGTATTAEPTGVAGDDSFANATSDAELIDHAYDGIREYDNPLPGWWYTSFWLAIVFAAGYWVWFHVADWGNTPDAKYKVALAEYVAQKGQREKAELREISEDYFASNATNPATNAKGQEIFTARCARCSV